MSALRGKADIPDSALMSANDPKRTLRARSAKAATAEIQNLSKMFTDSTAESMASAMVPRPVCSAR